MRETAPINPYLQAAGRLADQNTLLIDQNYKIENGAHRLKELLRRNKDQLGTNSRSIERCQEQALQFVLRESGLAVCDKFYSHPRDNLGIFPNDELRFVFNATYYASGYHAGYDYYIATFCSKHFPEEPTKVQPAPKLDFMEDTFSEIVEREGQFIRVLDDKDARFWDGKYGLPDREVPLRQGFTREMFKRFNLPEPTYLRESSGFTHYWYGSMLDICVPVGQLKNENVPVPSWIKYG